MFSPLDGPQVEQWFQRFNAHLKRLPAEECAELHSEVRQHLESLVAANQELGSSPQEAWNLALTQFGHPAQIGRRLAGEHQRGSGWVSPDMAAVLYMLGAYAVSVPILFFCTALFMAASHPYGDSGSAFDLEILFGAPVLAGAALGIKMPDRALVGASYAAVMCPLLPLMVMVGLSDMPSVARWPAAWLTLGCGSAYLASVTKRGWYRPSLANFKLTLPQKRWQTSK